jgi:alkylation response protein AidB-like acyl-CoA dehydrogenase
MSQLIDRRDLDFLLHDWLDVAGLLELPRFAGHDRATVDGVLDMSERLAAESFLTHYKESDRTEPRLDADGVHILPAAREALARYAELGLFSAGFAPELGGLGLPYTVCSAAYSIFAAANVSTVAYAMLTVGNARLIAAFGTPKQVETFALPEIQGRWFGTMCLSEPQAGSDLAEVRTRAVPDGSDELGERYRLTGNKMWISGGDQDASENIVHLILAKVQQEDGSLPEGTAGLSLFIVPKRLPGGTSNDVVVAGLNHKMGYRGTANCLLSLGDMNGAVGWMVGEPGLGLKQMFLMMNEARIGVGMGAAALGYRGYLLSVQYARERLQGRAPGARSDPRSGSPAPIIEHPDVKRMLLAQKAYAEGALALCLYCAKLVDQEDNAESQALLELLTPVAKTWPSEYGLAANDLAIQVHGGYGYTRDFDVEQLYRDNRLNPIHEGTTGIQAMDLVGRKLLRSDGSGFAALRRRIGDTIERARGDAQASEWAEALEKQWTAIAGAIETLGSGDPARALDNATPLLSAFGHGVLAWLWLDQAVAAARSTADPAFSAGKRLACAYFFDHEVPRIAAWLSPVTRRSAAAADCDSALF